MDTAELYDDLEVACADALRGDPPGPLTASRLERACHDVLRRAGIGGAVVRCSSTGAGTEVRIDLPQPGRSVRQLVLRVS